MPPFVDCKCELPHKEYLISAPSWTADGRSGISSARRRTEDADVPGRFFARNPFGRRSADHRAAGNGRLFTFAVGARRTRVVHPWGDCACGNSFRIAVCHNTRNKRPLGGPRLINVDDPQKNSLQPALSSQLASRRRNSAQERDDFALPVATGLLRHAADVRANSRQRDAAKLGDSLDRLACRELTRASAGLRSNVRQPWPRRLLHDQGCRLHRSRR
jgi:hypothetical protein